MQDILVEAPPVPSRMMLRDASREMNIYGHVLPETMKDAAERMDAILAR